MNTNKIETTLGGVNNDESIALLTAKNEILDYKDNKKVSDIPIGTKYTVALPGNRFNLLTVKIMGADPIPNITDEQISEALSAHKFIWVRFTNCKVTIYKIGGDMVMSASAKSVELAKPEGTKQP